MAPQLQILSNILQRLENMETATTGYLYGIMYNDTLVVLTFSINSGNGEDKNITDHTALQLNLPADIYFCGILHIGECEEINPDVFKDIDITDNPLLLKYSRNTLDMQAYFYMHQKLEAVNNLSIISEDDLSRQFVYIRLQATLPLVAQDGNIVEALQESRKNIASGKIGIHFPSNDAYLFRIDDNLKDIMLKDILSTSKDQEKSSSNVNYNTGPVNIIHANMLLKMSSERNSEESIRYAPVLQHIKKSFDSSECNLHIDALSLVNLNVKSAELHAILVESTCRNIRLIEIQQENQSEETKLPEVMHFKPQGCGHLFTAVYPGNATNDTTMEYRKALHKALALDLTKPYFRRGNAIKFDIQTNGILVNPHQALLHKGIMGKLSIVDGLYSYHHYMQDKFDDNGWGCAYRSLQTIISWYRLQGYNEVPIPSHRKIQQCLIDIGDKSFTFLGSKQWIGSTEVSFVLQTLLNIDTKILRASSGEEMLALIPQLANHFDTQGTPIMIGGGVLAHTILGVSYDEYSGEGKFLILDPHYTGADHLPTVINKGWCGWKTKDFWKKDAFYNMCLPQRPIAF
ncbi:PREDICTED: ufm1-specific protease 2 [Wasmannia auropunctata]|uniref:ufm1-specific protease 2 n=1 Tax=Wasmannia auropunctata TaxID=64793 RepID=UPI0005F00F12|nr:PREDICTED: ufm1-specific protease 2 [Wasmannia auropunctata]XP_011702264.1 PREDICTED: ufm1-specific protease 2 [Wasmannia auropunctata]XP_011702265.1 PREDICTED: ufm1-specific protease 2 [Wasmannia auropunctata]XP_011702266.1 PREDICTED: ufm1-specific protease 2 [Wasmannia auropunctata]